MGGALEKVKKAVGMGLVKTGLRLLGHDLPPPAQGASMPPGEEEEEDEPLPPNVPPAVLSEAAREMLADGTPEWTPPPVEENVPLKGSVADRFRAARREMGR